MPTPTDRPRQTRRCRALIFALWAAFSGCGGEPSHREVQNARTFEALLTAVSLKNAKELERDATLIERRHASGEISDANHRALRAIVAKARSGDWQGAETQAYAFRAQCGERGAYFK